MVYKLTKQYIFAARKPLQAAANTLYNSNIFLLQVSHSSSKDTLLCLIEKFIWSATNGASLILFMYAKAKRLVEWKGIKIKLRIADKWEVRSIMPEKSPPPPPSLANSYTKQICFFCNSDRNKYLLDFKPNNIIPFYICVVPVLFILCILYPLFPLKIMLCVHYRLQSSCFIDDNTHEYSPNRER